MTWRALDIPTGVGLGLRWAFLDDVVDDQDPDLVPFFEVSPENYMRRGGWIPDALSEVLDRFRIISHGLMLNIGSTDPLEPSYLDQLGSFLRDVGAKYHSDHLCWSGGEQRILHDLLPLPTDRKVVRHVADRIRRVEDHLGLPMAMENISYYYTPGGDLPEHAFLAEVLETADCGLMLDVNNLWVNAKNHGFDPWDYLAWLPLERVVQLHVAGGQHVPDMDDLVIDTHGTPVNDEVRQLMATVVERIGPVPVVYERDHNIPALPRLLQEVRELDEVYRAALDRHGVARPSRSAAPGGPSPGIGIESHRAIESGLTHMISDVHAPAEFRRDPVTALQRRGLAEHDAVPLGAFGADRLLVYRSLVRRGLRSTVVAFLPRTVARMGTKRFDQEFATWMEHRGPHSRYLRDVPSEFVQWAAPQWRQDPTIASYLADLARHEMTEAEIEAAPKGPAGAIAGTELQLDAPLVFDRATTLVDYDHTVHELPADKRDRTEPAPEPVSLLVYRDGEHEVRFLRLTPLARALLGPLMQAQMPVRQAMGGAAESLGQALDDDLLGRASRLLADLAERGVLLGSGTG